MDEVPYAWIIDKDHIGNTKGVIGPHNANDAALQMLLSSLDQGRPFRMRLEGEDSVVAYEGRILWNPDIDEATWNAGMGLVEWEFAPLDDYGTPNAGCTVIEYQNEIEEWVGL
jgi:hypothetical protein